MNRFLWSIRMKVLIVFAHPEPKSFNGALKDTAVSTLKEQGHEVQVTDLYQLRWRPELGLEDFVGERLDPDFLDLSAEQEHMFGASTKPPPDVYAEQQKVLWCDLIIFQYPMWWFGMPAILKGWVERVYAYGFAYGRGEHSDRHWGDRYGQGLMAGKRAMLVVTTGGWATHYEPRGVNGPIEDLLFPIHHGILYYPGFQVLPPFVTYRIGRGQVDETKYSKIVEDLGKRIDDLWTTKPIPFRPQNAGDYEIPALTLRDELAPGEAGFAVHVNMADISDG